jgi:hypothetical protein
MGFIDGCKLHVPWKDWSDNPKERENYEEIERWSYRLAECSSCTCSVERGTTGGTLADGAITAINRPTTVVACGATDPGHLMILNVYAIIQGNAAGFRDLQVNAPSEGGTQHGMSSPGVIAWDGSQRLHVNRFFPAHVNTLVPKYQVLLWQNSGVPLSYNLFVEEYYPCCNCDYPLPC